MENQKIVKSLKRLQPIFKGLSDPTRLAIVSHLMITDGAIRVNEIAHAVGLPQSTVSRQLAGLSQAGIVVCTRTGSSHYYRVTVDKEALKELQALVYTLQRCSQD